MDEAISKPNTEVEAPTKASKAKKPGAKAAAKTTAAKAGKRAPKVKRERVPAGEICVFAFRLSTKERDRIHAAAGGGKASQFVLAAALAAAAGDMDQFKEVVSRRVTK